MKLSGLLKVNSLAVLQRGSRQTVHGRIHLVVLWLLAGVQMGKVCRWVVTSLSQAAPQPLHLSCHPLWSVGIICAPP